ncbi:hypothetical protein RIF29_00573 [Crotalaria pallida]|uniref:Uncharacterized protein n=1 Tax=Crotalaria pallida TaxID=3830 RepID=A0AAN9P7A1_CROPI
MLDSILEFITQAASSSAFIFCFCNLIVVIILVDLKPSLISVHQESEIPLSMDTTHKQETNSKCLVQKDIGSSPQVSQVQEAEEDTEAKALAVNNIEIKLV